MKKPTVNIPIFVILLLAIGTGRGWAINYPMNGSAHTASASAEQLYELVATPQNLQYLGTRFFNRNAK